MERAPPFPDEECACTGCRHKDRYCPFDEATKTLRAKVLVLSCPEREPEPTNQIRMETSNILLTKDKEREWFHASMSAGDASFQGGGKTPNEAVEDLMGLYERHKAGRDSQSNQRPRSGVEELKGQVAALEKQRLDRLEKLVLYIYGRTCSTGLVTPEATKVQSINYIKELWAKYDFGTAQETKK